MIKRTKFLQFRKGYRKLFSFKSFKVIWPYVEADSNALLYDKQKTDKHRI